MHQLFDCILLTYFFVAIMFIVKLYICYVIFSDKGIVYVSRLSELRDVVVELRNKQDSEIQERRMLEQQTQLK